MYQCREASELLSDLLPVRKVKCHVFSALGGFTMRKLGICKVVTWAAIVGVVLCQAACVLQDKGLIFASGIGQPRIVKLLLQNGADVNAKDKDGQTALMAASLMGHAEVVTLLVNKGADVNIGDKFGGTALLVACFGGHIEVVRLLIEKGADLNTKTGGGWTALMVASKEGHTQVVELLKSQGAKE